MKTVEQIKTLTGITITTINIGNGSKEWGQRISDKLSGKTYMNFQIEVCPIGGCWQVNAVTNYEGDKDQILGMFIYLMATEL